MKKPKPEKTDAEIMGPWAAATLTPYRGPCTADKHCPAMAVALKFEARNGLAYSMMLNESAGTVSARLAYAIDGHSLGIRYCPFCGEKVNVAAAKPVEVSP